MKKDTHPTMHPVIFRDTGANVDFIGTSTRKSETKETVDGVEYFVIPVEVSSASHPFYTGQENIIDSAGRVEKFKQRAEKRSKEGKKQKRETVTRVVGEGVVGDTGVESTSEAETAHEESETSEQTTDEQSEA